MMFSHKDKAERTAAQAWDYLSSAMAAAGESAKEAGKYTADLAGGKAALVGSKAALVGSKAAQAGGKAALAGGKAAELAGKAGKRGRKLTGNTTGQKLAGKSSALVGKSTALAGKAGGKADVAWSRANAAAAALAGRKPGKPWGLIAGVGLLGLAVGWAAASSARAALERQAEAEELELAETAVVVTPTFDR